MAKKDKQQKKLPAPSEEFEIAFRGSGSSVINCEFCDRVHFISDPAGYDWERGEHARLMKLAKQNPDRYVAHQEDSVSWGYLDGKQYVHGCQCNSASRYEIFLVRNRHQIAEFLKARAERIAKESQSESCLVQGL